MSDALTDEQKAQADSLTKTQRKLLRYARSERQQAYRARRGPKGSGTFS